MTCRPRDIPKAKALVERTLEILEYFRAPFWMENPGGAALLHKQEFMKFWEFCRTQVAYCNFELLGGAAPPLRVLGEGRVRVAGEVPPQEARENRATQRERAQKQPKGALRDT